MKNMKKPLLAPWLLLNVLLALGACNGIEDSKKRGVSGIVLMEPNIAESYMRTPTIDTNLGLKPVNGAKVLLTFDKEGKHLIEGCEVESDGKGFYKIDTSRLPRAKDQYGYYYLVVDKPGYQRFVHHITIGPWSRYQENTIILKPLAE